MLSVLSFSRSKASLAVCLAEFRVRLCSYSLLVLLLLSYSLIASRTVGTALIWGTSCFCSETIYWPRLKP